MKKTILKAVAKSAEKAVKEACGSKSIYLYYEPEMPACLKAKKTK
ncbi:MAG: cyclic lactone autoinducer peptide [Cellulosilyticum sp.]|nr:cyclic lactone autoinducer peptide [Cellulosilyticum sp.]MEE1071140.1 cyclic lactone autoinducer peptide [Cellulosilyticum sp.]